MPKLSLNLRPSLILLTILSSSCGDPGGSADSTLQDGSLWSPVTSGDAAVHNDAGGSAGGTLGDAGQTFDSGLHPLGDAGSMAVDSGAPPVSDAGTISVDASGPFADAGTMPSDAGPSVDEDASASGDAGGSSKPKGKFVGNITTRGQVRNDFVMFWDQITPENEGKWGSVEGTRNQMNWAGVDRVRDYAKQHGLVFKQHTFVWGSQQPSWLNGLSASQQRAEVEEWIRLFCERYPEVDIIDVVNEPPPHTTPVYAQALGGAGASGWDWIVQAFKWARQYCPSATLVLNDYNNIEYGDQNAHFISIAKAVKAAGAPIDAVGAQSHAAHSLSTSAVKGMLDKLASETGLPVYITEYDIDEASDDKQKQIMESQFTMFWNHGAVKGITLWGYIEGATWQQNSGLMSSTGQERPALQWLMNFLGR